MSTILESLGVLGLILIAIYLISFIIQIWYYLFLYGKPVYLKEQKKSITEEQPPVSVIICAQNEAFNLSQNIPLIFEQDYPEFQVIVVNDCSEDDTENELKLLKARFPNLYVTTIHSDPKFKHGKKLAQTIGIKAAKYEHLVFTDADCTPVSNQWIRLLMRNYTPETEFVVGVSPYIKQPGFVNHLLSFENLFIAIQYIGFAISGKPYMSVGRNLSYRRSVFFENKGFANHAHILSGDDDLFINSHATKKNLRVEIAHDARMMTDSPASFLHYRIQKRRHLEAGAYYKKSDLTRLLFEYSSRFSLLFSGIALIILGIFPIIVGAIYFIRLLIQGIIINLGAKKMGFRKFYFAYVLYDLLLPLISFYILALNKIKPTKVRWR